MLVILPATTRTLDRLHQDGWDVELIDGRLHTYHPAAVTPRQARIRLAMLGITGYRLVDDRVPA